MNRANLVAELNSMGFKTLISNVCMVFVASTILDDIGVFELELAWETEELRNICEHSSAAEAALGPLVITDFKARLADMRAAITVDDLFFGEQAQATNGSPAVIRIMLQPTGSIVFSSNHSRDKDVAGVDWSQVKRIRIMEITNDAV
ncbi:hypothetical protein L53_13010 [Hyphomonas sp. L-53-1-40]|uniref:hypothetical protein n=1 Tax=Hyphomonas sp. L-53-1-40 TaxID=1207058 RepID=UPI000458A757|nr:hypothetical protein [Hyphomonas sp. L-53-1-40]KCZ62156.1 hypothetical protein L53_13010 [Hyphomonas sp. L-53-1-40]